ncbi:HAMP domain-containing methyl-accepting chemotaxis protein [Paenibacillus ferrarius]|uniref:HAMP domain-containing methyl-accepting chemotaxis protein n=1 Tax=Paenibacillus ferrarius TaxID=1469647 RepID=UPI003D2C43A4
MNLKKMGFQALQVLSFKHMKVMGKLYLTYAIILLFMGVISFTSFYTIVKMKHSTNVIYEERLQSISELLSLSSDFQKLNSSVASLLLMKASEAKSAISQTNPLLTNIDKTLSYLQDRVSVNKINPDEFGTFHLIWAGYKEDLTVTLEFVNQGNHSVGNFTGMEMASNTYNQKMKNRIDSLSNILEKWSLANKALAETSYNEIIHLHAKLKSIMITTFIICISISILLGYSVSKSIVSPLNVIVRAANQIAQGNLNQHISIQRKDELGLLAQTFHDMIQQIRTLISNVKSTSSSVILTAAELALSSEQTTHAALQISADIQALSDRSNDQLLSSSESASSIQMLVDALHNITEETGQVAKLSSYSCHTSLKGNESIQLATKQMDQIVFSVENLSSTIQNLNNHTNNIGTIIEVISEISRQTNLLALNAAIEAARAGQAGRGFQVVASEIRTLSQRTTESAAQISTIIAHIQQATAHASQSMYINLSEVRSGKDAVVQVGEHFAGIDRSIREVTDRTFVLSRITERMNDQIHTVSQSIQQTSEIAHASSINAQSVAAAAEEQLASMQQVSASHEHLQQMAKDLEQSVSKFIV